MLLYLNIIFVYNYKDYKIHISITHEDNKALAFAIVEKNH